MGIQTRIRSIIARRGIAMRATALALAVWVSAGVWEAAQAPPSFVFGADGRPLLINGKPVRVQHAIWGQIAMMVISALISYALAPKPPKPKPHLIDDFDIPQANEGDPFVWVFGECFLRSPQVAAWGDLRNQPIKSKGKK